MGEDFLVMIFLCIPPPYQKHQHRTIPAIFLRYTNVHFWYTRAAMHH